MRVVDLVKQIQEYEFTGNVYDIHVPPCQYVREVKAVLRRSMMETLVEQGLTMGQAWEVAFHLIELYGLLIEMYGVASSMKWDDPEEYRKKVERAVYIQCEQMRKVIPQSVVLRSGVEDVSL